MQPLCLYLLQNYKYFPEYQIVSFRSAFNNNIVISTYAYKDVFCPILE